MQNILLVFSLFCILQHLIASKSKLSDFHRDSCDLYLAPSLLGTNAGRGVYAGKDYLNGDSVVLEQSLIVKYSTISDTQLNFYVYNAEAEGYSMVVFGAACLFNHNSDKDLAHFWNDDVIPPVSMQLNEAHANFTNILYATTKNLKAGQELFVSYGRDSWFGERGIPFDSKATSEASKLVYDLQKLKEVGHCLSDIFMDESFVPMAGKGVFTSRSYKKGEMVAISPVLTLPRHIVADQDPEIVLMNYCIGDNDSDVFLLPLTLIALANHGGIASNIEMEWFSWTDDKALKETLAESPDELVDAKFARLDLAYRATTDIEAGEELLVSYGEEWEREWLSHLEKLQKWAADSNMHLHSKPQFRQPIRAPSGLFPEAWKVPCVGKTCEQVVDGEAVKTTLQRRHPALLKNIVESKQHAQRTFIFRIQPSDEL